MAHTWEKRGAYGVLMGKPEKKRPLGRRSSIWEDNIRMNRKESRWDSANLIDLVQIGTVGGSCQNGKNTPGAIQRGEFLDSWETISFS